MLEMLFGWEYKKCVQYFPEDAAGKGYLLDKEVDGGVILTLILWKQLVRNSYLSDVLFVLST